ncbi:MAG: hydrolase [Parcubacteria group bacterium]|nr:hydrolase [Parcubacteria group bacterium]
MTLPEAEYYAGLAKKGCGAAVLLFNERGELLIVDPNYKPDWGLPGGAVDADESPRLGALREVREELGISLSTLTLIGVDYIPSNPPRTEALYLTFDGGVLNGKEIESIILQKDELDEYRFVDIAEAIQLLNPRQGGRLPACLEARAKGTVAYTENGMLT